MSENLHAATAVIGIDIGKSSFHVVGHDQRGAIVLHQKWSRGQVAARFANMPPRLIGMEACVGAHHLSRKLKGLGHDARLMPAKYVRPYSKGQKNDFRDAEAIAEAVLRVVVASLRTPLSTLRLQPHDHTRMTRGRCSSLRLHRDGLAPSTLRRSPGAPVHSINRRHSNYLKMCTQRRLAFYTLRQLLGIPPSVIVRTFKSSSEECRIT